ncbi:MAG TPA: hypothetical protein VFO29_02835 [Candidatus Rubrimentiphilum sp.]|nr:hypothetical protein [Candidatus Rubrimentiphilum sp.]
MKIWGLALAAALAILMAPLARAGVDPLVARGKYLVGFGSCNDCHTPGWRESDGRIPVSQWMTGSKIGYRGPWGTSYAANVRIEFSQISEKDWLFMVRTRAGRWPMVWHDLRMLRTTDQQAIYRFVRSLGARGKRAPADVPPGREPSTPYVWVVPH